MVVTGMATGAVVDNGGRGPLPFPFVAVAVCVTISVPVTTVVEVVGGIGTRVIELGTPVQIPGFCGTKSAQIPAK
jgi:hypothetical protein